jgi:hypothetical protein
VFGIDKRKMKLRTGLRFFPREASEKEEARVAVGGMGGGGGFCAGCLRRGGV